MVHIQQWLVQIGQVKVILGFIIFSKSFIFWGRKFAQWSKICVDISNIKSMRLIKISIPKMGTDIQDETANAELNNLPNLT